MSPRFADTCLLPVFNSVGTLKCCQLQCNCMSAGGISIIILWVSGPLDFANLVSIDSGQEPVTNLIGASAKTKLAHQVLHASPINAPQETALVVESKIPSLFPVWKLFIHPLLSLLLPC